jgi:hypothetical protein
MLLSQVHFISYLCNATTLPNITYFFLRTDGNFCSVHEEITSIRLYTPCRHWAHGTGKRQIKQNQAKPRGSQKPVITHLVFNWISKVSTKWECHK